MCNLNKSHRIGGIPWRVYLDWYAECKVTTFYHHLTEETQDFLKEGLAYCLRNTKKKPPGTKKFI